jgi:hypothetical protein
VELEQPQRTFGELSSERGPSPAGQAATDRKSVIT